TPTRWATRVSMLGKITVRTANTAKAMISRRRTASCFAPRLASSHAMIPMIPTTSSSWMMTVRLPTPRAGPRARRSGAPIGSALAVLLVGGGRAVAEDQTGRAGPVLGGGDVAAVHDQLHAGHVLRGELCVLGVVGLDDDEVRRLTRGVGVPAETGELVLVVEGVVHGDLRATGAQRLDHGEHTGERGLLHPGPVGGAEHHSLHPLEGAKQPG